MSSPCNPLSYYIQRFTSEYQLSQKLLTWAGAPINLLGDACSCAASFNQAFDIDTAVGPQLDMIGAELGQPRVVNFDLATNIKIAVNGTQVSDGTLCIAVNGTVVACPNYTIAVNGVVLFSNTLDDNTYRLLLKAKILKNQWDGTISSLNSGWKTLFPGGTIIINDNEDMTATILMSGSFTEIIQNLITHGYIVPRPEGVQYNYTFATLPIFGFDLNNTAYISGFDTGKWS